MVTKKWIHYGHSKFISEKFDSYIRPHSISSLIKISNCGLWASPIKHKNDNLYTWYDFCIEKKYEDRIKTHFTFNLKNNSKILYIKSIVDLLIYNEIVFVNKDTFEIFRDKLHSNNINEINEAIYLLITQDEINWGKIISDYDGLYIAAGSDEILRQIFYGWDCDSICIFNKDIIEI